MDYESCPGSCCSQTEHENTCVPNMQKMSGFPMVAAVAPLDERLTRALADLNRVKFGDTLTHFDDITLAELFALAPASTRGSLVGMELHVAGGDGAVSKLLVGSVGQTILESWDAALSVRMARMVWFG